VLLLCVRSVKIWVIAGRAERRGKGAGGGGTLKRRDRKVGRCVLVCSQCGPWGWRKNVEGVAGRGAKRTNLLRLFAREW